MSAIKTTCPHCQVRVRIDAQHAGKKLRCQKCGQTFRVAGTTSAPAGAGRQTAPASAGDAVPWQPGSVILDLYEVQALLGEGGMGRVYRVHHKGWDVDLAVKVPRPQLLARPGAVEDFEREAETWVNLGLHPHTTSCYYVRRLDTLPLIFAELVSGGSLKDWIENGKLYAGGPQATLPRLLDIAIQFAWGLHHAHEHGLVHQDVKPANVLMTTDGIAKVTDFGLAKARAVIGEAAPHAPTAQAGAGQSILVSSGGMTPAYCSPEQANREKLTRRTDLWSWAVSVLEMFTGGVTWSSGTVAAEALEAHLETGAGDDRLPVMSARVADLLRSCLQQKPAKRPRDMLEAAKTLRQIYRQETGNAYARAEPETARAVAANLNNRAVSLLDLGKPDAARKLWEQALKADAHHLETVYNLELLRWRGGELDDQELVRRLEALRDTHPGVALTRCLLARVHLERGDAAAAVRALEAAQANAEPSGEVAALLETARAQMPHAMRSLHTWSHACRINAACLSNDGRQAMTGDGEGTLRWWDTAGGERVHDESRAHESEVRAVSLSDDGSMAASIDHRGTLRLWALSMWAPSKWEAQCRHETHAHLDAAWCVSLTPDGRLAVTSGQDKTVKLWDTKDGICLKTFEGHSEGVLAAGLSGDGRLAVSGGYDKAVKLWDTKTGRCLHTMQGHTEQVNSVQLSRDGRFAVSASEDKTVKLWDVATGKCLRTFRGHEDSVNRVSLSHDGRRLVSVCKAIKLWETATGRCLHTLPEADESLSAVSLSGDGRLAISSGSAWQAYLWDMSLAGTLPAAPALSRWQLLPDTAEAQRQHDRAVAQARQALERGDAGAAARHVRRARAQPGYERSAEALALWRRVSAALPLRGLAAVHLLHNFRDRKGIILDTSLSGDGRLALWRTSTLGKTHIDVREVSTGRSLSAFEIDDARAATVAFSADGSRMLIGDRWGKIEVWDTMKGKGLGEWADKHAEWIRGLCTSADGRRALSGSDDKTARLWDMKTGRCLHVLQGHTERIDTVSLSGDGRLALTGSMDKTVKLWDGGTGRCLFTLPDFGGWGSGACLGHDGRLALSTTATGEIKVWQTEDGTCVRSLQGHTEAVRAVALSRDGRLALSGGRDKTARLWEVASGRCLHTFSGHSDLVLAVSLSADRCVTMTGGGDQTVELSLLDWDLEVPPATGPDDDAAEEAATEEAAGAGRPRSWWQRWLGRS